MLKNIQQHDKILKIQLAKKLENDTYFVFTISLNLNVKYQKEKLKSFQQLSLDSGIVESLKQTLCVFYFFLQLV